MESMTTGSPGTYFADGSAILHNLLILVQLIVLLAMPGVAGH